MYASAEDLDHLRVMILDRGGEHATAMFILIETHKLLPRFVPPRGPADATSAMGCLQGVSEWAARHRQAEKVDGGAFSRTPSTRTIARLLTIGRDGLARWETVTVAAIEGGVPPVEVRDIIAAFRAMIRKKSLVDIEPWLKRAGATLGASFASGVVKDQAAVSAAITSARSNGRTEGQIAQLKKVEARDCREISTI